MKLSQEQANLIKGDRDLAAFRIIFEDRYGEKFGDDERDKMSKWE